MRLEEIVKERILILDGAMGTMIQRYGLTEADFRGERFRDVPGLRAGDAQGLYQKSRNRYSDACIDYMRKVSQYLQDTGR